MNYMNNIKLGIAAVALTAMACSGRETRTELSNILSEEATVAGKRHTNAWTQIIPMHIGKTTTIIPIHHSERNVTTFTGVVRFEVNDKDVYNRFDIGDKAYLFYRESIEFTFEDLDKDGTKEQTGRLVTGYEFYDAQAKK